MEFKIILPTKVNTIIETIQANGYEAYAVGGCVRDSILGRTPKDWDITTSASPEEVKSWFAKTFDTGIEHGTVTVLVGNEGFEVTTYRIDGIYEDSRHPKEVSFTRELKEDLLRRDFTINAMAYNKQEGLVDIFGGIDDLDAGIIRCVGDAKERFSEDALRILRAIRFASQLGFEIEHKTVEAIQSKAPTLDKISAERVQTELIKIMVSPHPDQIKRAYELGITKVILPEFDAMMVTKQETPHHCMGVGEHTVKALLSIRAEKVLRLTMLLHDVAKPLCKTIDENGAAHFKRHEDIGEHMAKEILQRLKFDNDTLRKVCLLIRWHDCRIPAKQASVRRQMYKMGAEMFPFYLEVRRADLAAQSDYLKEEKKQILDETEEVYKAILANQECTSLKQLSVTGKDLIALGVKPGKEMGDILDGLLFRVLEDPKLNQKDRLLTIVKESFL